MPLTKSSQVHNDLEGILGKGPLTNGFEDCYPAVERVILKDSLVRNEQTLRQVPLEPLNCSFGVVKHEEQDAIPLRRVIRRQLRDGASDVSIVFAVRRPACGNCCEHGRQLYDLAALDKQVSLVGVVKETGVADQELVDFYQHYFRRPIYLDSKWKVFKAMGGRKLSMVALLARHLIKNRPRYQKKEIVNIPLAGGDMLTQGGLLFFDKKGTLRFAYDEVFGEELDMKAVNAAIHLTRLINEQEYGSTSSTSSTIGDNEKLSR